MNGLRLVAGIGLLAALGALGVLWKTQRAVREALRLPENRDRPLLFVAQAVTGAAPRHWGGTGIDGVALVEGGLVAAGASGVFTREGALDAGLPTLRASALASWRGRLVAALESGGYFRRVDARWEEARSGWGTLHVRTLLETASGELLIGAREGLFRSAWGASRLERLDTHPVRCLAVGSGFLVAGGEQGLWRIEGVAVRRLGTPDPWIESVALIEDTLFAVSAAGLARGAAAGELTSVRGGEDALLGIALGDRFVTLSESGETLRRFDTAGHFTEEVLPSPGRRIFAVEDVLVVDARDGLLRRDRNGWLEALPRPDSLPWPTAHVGALAFLGEALVAGRFDGGLASTPVGNERLAWRAVEGSAAWGVNALLGAGGTLYVASLRGAARFDGRQLQRIEGPGAAFSLAATPEGVAIGYGQGVLLPGERLLSAFHGLPANQATALASGKSLFVGTPSGLGAIRARRVEWRVVPGEGRLPNPWVTARWNGPDALYVGTYGGGVARRDAAGRFVPFVETEGMKVSAGGLVPAGNDLFLGTEGRGVFRLSADRQRFEAVRIALPSPFVTALLAAPGALYVGTHEGVARLPLVAGRR